MCLRAEPRQCVAENPKPRPSLQPGDAVLTSPEPARHLCFSLGKLILDSSLYTVAGLVSITVSHQLCCILQQSHEVTVTHINIFTVSTQRSKV